MHAAKQVHLLERLLAASHTRGFEGTPQQTTVPVQNYFSAERLEDERAHVFLRHPLIIGRVSELAAPGDYLTHDASGVAIVALRDGQGQLRAFINTCRHRGSRLATEERGNLKKAFVCRYHAWTYDLTGALVHVPRQETFPGLDCAKLGLVALPIEAKHGFLWVRPSPGELSVGPYLGAVGEDLSELGVEGYHLYRRVTSRHQANWKLVIDAFQEGYHAKFLHRQSVARFFADDAIVDLFPPHSRSCGARLSIRGLPAIPKEQWDLRAHTTLFYLVFPNTILVFHPDYLSQISVFPAGTDSLIYTHAMLIPGEPKTDKERAHWEKTFQLIEQTVFQREDLAMAESIQQGIRSGADAHFRLGALEQPIYEFHRSLDRAIAEGRAR